MIGAIKSCVRTIEAGKQQDVAAALYVHVFDSLLEATSRAGTYLRELTAPEVRKCESAAFYEKVAHKFRGFTGATISFALDICFASTVRDDPGIWTKMRQFCQNFQAMQILVPSWQAAICEASGNLSDLLASVTEEELTIISSHAPFEGLPMKKQYVLQVLYNASSDAIELSPVRLTAIYRAFTVWRNLLGLVRLDSAFPDREVLEKYVPS